MQDWITSNLILILKGLKLTGRIIVDLQSLVPRSKSTIGLLILLRVHSKSGAVDTPMKWSKFNGTQVEKYSQVAVLRTWCVFGHQKSLNPNLFTKRRAK